MATATAPARVQVIDFDREAIGSRGASDRSAAALDYAAAGVPVVPLHPVDGSGACTCPDGADCTRAGKHPRIMRWQHRATCREPSIRGWWSQWPDANVGLAMGHEYRETGLVLVALDVDPRHGGDASLAELEHEHGALPATVTSRTGSGGRHLLFLLPESDAASLRNNSGEARPGLDVRTIGGQIVAPPSVHASGREYEWIGDTEHPAEMPAWLLDVLMTAGKGSPRPLGEGRTGDAAAVAVPDDADRDSFLMDACLPERGGSRHRAGLRWAASMRDAGATYEETMALAPEFRDRAELATDADHAFEPEEIEEIVAGAYAMVEPAARIRTAAAAEDWRGARLAVMDAMLRMAVRACKPAFVASARTLAQEASCHEATAWRCAWALERDGWVRSCGRGLHGATEWTFDGAERSANATESGYISLYRSTHPTTLLH